MEDDSYFLLTFLAEMSRWPGNFGRDLAED
jgi:hypothetical protein